MMGFIEMEYFTRIENFLLYDDIYWKYYYYFNFG